MKKILSIILAVVLIMSLCACNRKVFDTKWSFHWVYIQMPDGSIKETEIKAWTEDGTTFTLDCADGNTYMTSQVNCLLTKERLENYDE